MQDECRSVIETSRVPTPYASVVVLMRCCIGQRRNKPIRRRVLPLGWTERLRLICRETAVKLDVVTVDSVGLGQSALPLMRSYPSGRPVAGATALPIPRCQTRLILECSRLPATPPVRPSLHLCQACDGGGGGGGECLS